MRKLVKGVASFEVVEQVLYGNSGAVEYWHASLDVGITENNRLCDVRFLLLPFNDTPVRSASSGLRLLFVIARPQAVAIHDGVLSPWIAALRSQ